MREPAAVWRYPSFSDPRVGELDPYEGRVILDLGRDKNGSLTYLSIPPVALSAWLDWRIL